MPSPFDFSSFMTDTTYDATKIDYKWHNVPEGGYMAQLKEFARSAEQDVDKWNGRHVITADVMWIIQDENLKSELNLTEITVRQSLIVERAGPGGPIDWGTNKNMGLKNLMLATDTNKNKNWNFGHLLNQVAWVTVKNLPSKAPGADPEVLYSNITKVEPLAAGRAAYEAKQKAA
jgi:hypothetical protein